MTVNNTQLLSAREIWSILDRTRFAISRLREIELAKCGLTIEQSSVLYILINLGGSTTAKELENITMRQHHSISALVNGMVKMDLVSKSKRAGEKRHQISITQEGLRLYSKTTIASIEETISSLSEQDQLNLERLLICLLTRARELLGISADSSLKIMNDNDTSDKRLHMHELWTLLDRTRFAISRLRELELARFKLTIEQASVLHLITHNGGSTTAKQLEIATMRQQNSVSSLINGMARMGLVNKVRDSDGKRFNLILTQSGYALYKDITVNSLGNVFYTLQKEDRQTLIDYMEILLERARFLLGITFQPPFLQYLSNSNNINQK